jgi:hypothetical protein
LCCAEPADRVGLSVAIAAVMHAQRESVEAN